MSVDKTRYSLSLSLRFRLDREVFLSAGRAEEVACQANTSGQCRDMYTIQLRQGARRGEIPGLLKSTMPRGG